MAVPTVEREVRTRALEEKNRLLDEAFSRAAREFARLGAEDLRELYGGELRELDLRGARLLVPKGSGKTFKAFLRGAGRVEEDASIRAGYVVLHEDFRLDRTLEARLEELRAEMRAELARTLFEGEA